MIPNDSVVSSGKQDASCYGVGNGIAIIVNLGDAKSSWPNMGNPVGM